MDKEIRMFNFEVRAEDTDRGHTITGRPIVFGQMTDIGWYDEVIERGALDETDLKDVRLLVNHNVDMIPLARSRNNTENSTMRLMPDENGLGIRADLDTENNADAKSLFSAVSRGTLMECPSCSPWKKIAGTILTANTPQDTSSPSGVCLR